MNLLRIVGSELREWTTPLGTWLAFGVVNWSAVEMGIRITVGVAAIVVSVQTIMWRRKHWNDGK